MRMPKRGEKGFTLIELMIVVAILGVLAAVVIPNVGRFIGRGEEEAKDTEFANIQAAVHAMMVDNELATLPAATFVLEGARTKDMGAFPSDAECATAGEKVLDVAGASYDAATDKDGYLLYAHDRIAADGFGADNTTLVNSVAQPTTAYWYYVDESGTVSQDTTGP